MKGSIKDKTILFSVADGPESIEIYTSEEEGVVDWSETFPAVYITVTNWNTMVKLGPFSLSAIYRGIVEQLKKPVEP